MSRLSGALSPMGDRRWPEVGEFRKLSLSLAQVIAGDEDLRAARRAFRVSGGSFAARSEEPCEGLLKIRGP
jgi:hypothetical protein